MMTQQEVFDVFKENPYMKFKPEDIRQELKAKGINLNIQTVYRSLRALAHLEEIKKEKGDFWYEPSGQNRTNQILLESN